jgi:SAM-dependent methyltransferase
LLVVAGLRRRYRADAFDQDYAAKSSSHAMSSLSRSEVDFVASSVSPTEVLDIGCGTGHVLDHLTRAWGASGTGVDVNERALETARALFGERLHFQVARSSLPFRSGAFDHVILHHTIGHLPSPRLTLTEAHRVLRPGGTISVIHVNPSFKLAFAWSNIKTGYRADATILRYHSRKSMGLLLQDSGFEEFAVAGFGFRTVGVRSWRSSHPVHLVHVGRRA